MSDHKETHMKHLLQDALFEIQQLRRRNEILEAKVEVVTVFAAALLGPRTQQGMSIDVAWTLQQKINELEAGTPAPVGTGS